MVCSEVVRSRSDLSWVSGGSKQLAHDAGFGTRQGGKLGEKAGKTRANYQGGLFRKLCTKLEKWWPMLWRGKKDWGNVSSHNSDGRKVETRQNVGSAHGFSAICGKNYILCQGWDCRVIIYVSLTCNVVRDTVPSFCL